jgi:Flp pilus assembly protein protease CpaA
MSSSDSILMLFMHSLIVAMVIIGGVQDWRTGMVSNWITIPLFIMGLVAAFWRVFLPDQRAIGIEISLAVAALTISAYNGWMGGADWKVQTGLFGLWPVAGLFALIASGVWGAINLLKDRKAGAKCPAVTASAIAVTLTFSAELFTITRQLIKV